MVRLTDEPRPDKQALRRAVCDRNLQQSPSQERRRLPSAKISAAKGEAGLACRVR